MHIVQKHSRKGVISISVNRLIPYEDATVVIRFIQKYSFPQYLYVIFIFFLRKGEGENIVEGWPLEGMVRGKDPCRGGGALGKGWGFWKGRDSEGGWVGLGRRRASA